MEILPSKKISWSNLLKCLKKGGVIVFPTDTAYGLGADFLSTKALKKIFLIKERPKEKKVALVAAGFFQVKKFFKLNAKEKKLARRYWPGPLTLVLNLKNKNKKVGVRIPKIKIAREICRRYGRPITATSANLSGADTPYSAQAAIRQFKGKKYQPDIVIDGGRLPKVKPSTIAEIKNDKIKIIREGPIAL